MIRWYIKLVTLVLELISFLRIEKIRNIFKVIVLVTKPSTFPLRSFRQKKMTFC